MKSRYSVEKNKWSSEREGWYFRECQNIAFHRKEKLEYLNGCVYIMGNEAPKLICEPVMLNKVWFETWSKYK